MKILVLPGDGIGPEITEATLAVLDRANAKYRLGLEWQMMEIGLKTLKTPFLDLQRKLSLLLHRQRYRGALIEAFLGGTFSARG